jgi:hypothetical protein
MICILFDAYTTSNLREGEKVKGALRWIKSIINAKDYALNILHDG